MKKKELGDGEPGATLVPVVWFETVQRWERRHDEALSTLFFHKIATLTRFRLEQKGIRVPLPYAWYLFGTTAEHLPYTLRFFPDSDSEQTKVQWGGGIPELFEGDRSADAIRTTIDSILDDYPPDEGERAVDEVYSHAPFEFQRQYRRVRIAAGLTGLGSSERGSLNVAGGLWELLLDAFDEFPYDRFPTLAPSVAVARESVNVGLNANIEQRRGLAVEVIDDFWRIFCAYLRIDPEGHKNIPSSTIQNWRRTADSRLRMFNRNLGDIVVELAGWDPSIGIDATLGPILDRRRTEQIEEERLVEEGLEVLAGDRMTSGNESVEH